MLQVFGESYQLHFGSRIQDFAELELQGVSLNFVSAHNYKISFSTLAELQRFEAQTTI